MVCEAVYIDSAHTAELTKYDIRHKVRKKINKRKTF